MGRWRPLEHDPRRWRRCDPAPSPRRPRRGGHPRPRQAHQRGGACPLCRHQETDRRATRLVRQEPRRRQGCHRGDHHRRPPPLPDAQARRAEVPRHQRQRLRHQVQVRQPVRLPRVVGGRHQARHRCDGRRQDRRRVRLRRRGQGFGPGPACPLGPGVDHRDRPHLRVAGRHGRLPRRHDGLRLRQGRHLRDGHGELQGHYACPHGQDEESGHRLQHRSLRQRDRRRVAGRLPLGGDQAAGRSRHLPRPEGGSSCSPRGAWSTSAAAPATPRT